MSIYLTFTLQPQWTRKGEKPALYDENYIPSIFITGDAAEIDDLVKNVPKTKLKTTATFIGANFVNTFGDVKFALHGAGKKKNNAKQSWKIELQGNDSLANRTYFKLRHMEEDPTQIRERLYSDVLHALGTYANEATMIRLFLNGEFWGTFNMLDDITEYSFINAMFYNGKPPAKFGPLYDGATGADFLYHPGNLDGYASWEANKQSPEDYGAFDPLCKAFNETDVTNNAAVASFGKMFDVDRFLRMMVMEYLTGAWDNYWMFQSNDGAYKDPSNNDMWYFIDQDFDGTFGVNLAEPEGTAFPAVSYKDWPARYPGAVMINRLLQNADTKTKFEGYLTETVRVLFNNVTLTNRVLALHDFMLPDLKADRAIVQKSPGINYGWNFEQVTQNLWTGVGAPNANGGGASWGLVEWIAAKSTAMAKEFNIQIVTEPVYPPNANGSVVPSGNKTTSVAPSASNSGSNKDAAATDSKTTSQNKAQSAATHVVPTSIALVAISAIAAAVL